MKKGFTLVELIGVLVILSLITLIAVPAVTNSLKKYKKSLCETQLENIVASGRSYGADHLLQLPEETDEPLTITLSELIKQGYIKGDKDATQEPDKFKIINPKTKKYYEPDPTITIKKVGKNYEYKLDQTTIDSCN